jgi:hypothetical protein
MGFVDELELNHLESISYHPEPSDVPYYTYWNKDELVARSYFQTCKEKLFWIRNKKSYYKKKIKKLSRALFQLFRVSIKTNK